MSQLHADLTEQAAQLGFHSIEEAEINGYEVDYEKGILVEGREMAHEMWLEKRNQIIKNLTTIKDRFDTDGYDIYANWLEETINFIKQGEI